MNKYSIISYFDFTSTASCGNSPIFVSSVGTGCNAAVEENSNALVCAAYNNEKYSMYSTMCSPNHMDLTKYKRNYVVKTIYHSSSKCEGDPIQSFALAADSMCHSNPSGGNSTSASYFKTNCNGGQPIWEECSDSSCKNCKTYKFTNEPCQLTSAASSEKVYCHSYVDDSLNLNSDSKEEHVFDGELTNDPFTNSSRKKATINWTGILYVVLMYFTLI